MFKSLIFLTVAMFLSGCNFDPTRFREPNPALFQQGMQMLYPTTQFRMNCTHRNVGGTVQTHCW